MSPHIQYGSDEAHDSYTSVRAELTSHCRKTLCERQNTRQGNLQVEEHYRQVSNIRRTKPQHLKDSRTALRLELSHWDLVTPFGDMDLANIGSGNGLLPDGTKPLPEPMLT